MGNYLVNGEIYEFVHAADRGLNYGDGLFETIAVVNGQPRWWQDHMDRLAAGCEQLGLETPPQALLLREVHTVAAGNPRCVVKIVLTRGPGGRGYGPPGVAEMTRVVSSHPWPVEAPSGITASECELRLAIQPRLGGIKHLNRLEQVLASAELENSGADEGILFDSEDYLISGIHSNLFLVFARQLLTPRLDRCGVRGVMRARILKSFRARCEQRRVSREMLEGASEVFMCNAVRGITPVLRIDRREYPVGPVTLELQQWLKESVGEA